MSLLYGNEANFGDLNRLHTWLYRVLESNKPVQGLACLKKALHLAFPGIPFNLDASDLEIEAAARQHMKETEEKRDKEQKNKHQQQQQPEPQFELQLHCYIVLEPSIGSDYRFNNGSSGGSGSRGSSGGSGSRGSSGGSSAANSNGTSSGSIGNSNGSTSGSSDGPGGSSSGSRSSTPALSPQHAPRCICCPGCAQAVIDRWAGVQLRYVGSTTRGAIRQKEHEDKIINGETEGNPFYEAEAQLFLKMFNGNKVEYLKDLRSRTVVVAVARKGMPKQHASCKDGSFSGSNLCLHMLMVLGVETALILRHPEALNTQKIAAPINK